MLFNLDFIIICTTLVQWNTEAHHEIHLFWFLSVLSAHEVRQSIQGTFICLRFLFVMAEKPAPKPVLSDWEMVMEENKVLRDNWLHRHYKYQYEQGIRNFLRVKVCGE